MDITRFAIKLFIYILSHLSIRNGNIAKIIQKRQLYRTNLPCTGLYVSIYM